MPEAQSRVARDRALAVDDLAHPVGRHVDLACELGGRDPQFFQFILENLAGMDGALQHGTTSFHEMYEAR